MNVSLTPQLEQFVREKVESGHYSSASEVVRASLRSLEREERQLDELRRLMAEARESLDRGEGIEVTESFWEDLNREVDRRLGKT